jgi:hypothetical protein
VCEKGHEVNLRNWHMTYPKSSAEHHQELLTIRKQLEK